MHKKLFPIFVLLLILTASCAKKQDASSTEEKAATATQGDAGARDISTATLVSLDPEIQQFDDAVVSAKSKYDKDQNPANTAELLKAYIAFADYMQYENRK